MTEQSQHQPAANGRSAKLSYSTGWWRWWWWAWLSSMLWAWSEGAVIPPLWVNETTNPCSTKSWQLLYWQPDQSCHRIFTQGPCGKTQEFYYDRRAGAGACRCPRGSLYYSRTGLCYPEYTQGPCASREYLAPDDADSDGMCKAFLKCPTRYVFWPEAKKCYEYHTRGPCLKGYLIYMNPDTGFPECGCDRKVMFSNYWSLTSLCFELFKRGPCPEGTIFLYNATKGTTECSCSSSILTNYYQESNGCYELNHQGPCNPGQDFIFEPHSMSTKCQCRDGHVLWPHNRHCYRLYSRGPCEKSHFFIGTAGNTSDTGECRLYPCTGTRRYHPDTESCYRLGWRGPCPDGQLFIYDEESPLRGTCGCTSELVGFWEADSQCYELGGRGPCQHSQILSYNKATGGVLCTCDIRKGYVKWHDDHCYRLETRGPCGAGELLSIKRWRPLIPTCTSASSLLIPNIPLLLGNTPNREDTSDTQHESNSVTAARGDSSIAVGGVNNTIRSRVSDTHNQEGQTRKIQLVTASTTHRRGRQLSERPAPTNIYSLGAVDSTYTTEGEEKPHSVSGSDSTWEDAYTWGLLDSSNFKIPDGASGSYFTGRSDGERATKPWWGQTSTTS